MKITCYGDCSPGCAFMDQNGKCTSDCDNIHDEDEIMDKAKKITMWAMLNTQEAIEITRNELQRIEQLEKELNHEEISHSHTMP